MEIQFKYRKKTDLSQIYKNIEDISSKIDKFNKN